MSEKHKKRIFCLRTYVTYCAYVFKLIIRIFIREWINKKHIDT